MPARLRTKIGSVSGDFGLLPEHENIKLLSPTSVSMKNSFIIKTSSAQKFDVLYKKLMARKKNIFTQPSNLNTNSQANLPAIDSEHLNIRNGKNPLKHTKTLNKGRRPPARDGHSGMLVLNQFLLVFGGDRH